MLYKPNTHIYTYAQDSRLASNYQMRSSINSMVKGGLLGREPKANDGSSLFSTVLWQYTGEHTDLGQ
jgi:hypothetical protein